MRRASNLVAPFTMCKSHDNLEAGLGRPRSFRFRYSLTIGLVGVICAVMVILSAVGFVPALKLRSETLRAVREHAIAFGIDNFNKAGLGITLVRQEQEELMEGERRVKFEGHDPLYDFILIDGFRMNSNRFAAVGMGALAKHTSRKLEGCTWRSTDGEIIAGNLTAYFPGEHHDLTYEAINLHCMFDARADLSKGGELMATINSLVLKVYEEKQAMEQMEPLGPFAHELTFCSPPIYGTVDAQRILEWVLYHSRLGMDYFIMYNAGGIDSEVRQMLEPFLKKGVMELVNVVETLKYETWLFSQVVLMNDCAYRTRFNSKWSFFMDFDEYFDTGSPDISLPALLQNYESKPYATFGSLWWAIDMCDSSAPNQSWPVEKMIFHWPGYYCVHEKRFPHELCLDYWGHRKYVVNPRKVTALQVHRPEVPQEGGVDVDAKVARMNHFQGLLKKNSTKLCKKKVGPMDKDDWWVRGTQIANFAKLAQARPVIGAPSLRQPVSL